MTREESILAKHLIDLSRQAYHKGIVTYSDFLNLNEQSIFHTCISELSCGFEMHGGYDYAERQMIAFLPDALMFRPEYPYVCLKMEPANRKFADVITHRDVLGSLMSLGIERSKIGDILVKDNSIFVFCHTNISAFIQEELTRIRHTAINIQRAEPEDPGIRPNLEMCECIVTSNRLDGLIASMCRLSRSQAADLIKKGSVFINGKETINTSYSCKEKDIISIRGFGRFRFACPLGETRKGRIKIQYYKYV